MPTLWAGVPFALLILAIALFPLLPKRLERVWEDNRAKFIIAAAFAIIVLIYYAVRRSGFAIGVEQSSPGWSSVAAVIHYAILEEYFPFIVLLLALYTISGGIRITGDLAGHPATNTFILFLGAILANLIGTTGASMLLIRPLLQINSDRHRTKHIVIFFIFIVSNIAGLLTPIGPPLFLGYLLGVPFGWPLRHLWPMTLVTVALLLTIHFVWDTIEYRREVPSDRAREELDRVPFRLVGGLNLIWIMLTVLTVATVMPDRSWLGTRWTPFPGFREIVLLLLTAVAYRTTRADIRRANDFHFKPILEVACLFLGIFVTLVPLIEWLNQSTFTLTHPWQYFWATGALSAILDNAPTYIVFFQLASHSTAAAREAVLSLPDGQAISTLLLTAVSCGAVFMGGLSYIGNAPNFMVKSLANSAGVKMPGFFGFMLYGMVVLIPIFVLITLLFFH